MAKAKKKVNWLDKFTSRDKESSSIRLIHTIKIEFTEKLDDIDERVNTAIVMLAKRGCKIVSINSKQVGLQPIYMLYEIIYEPQEELTKEIMNFEKAENNG